MSDSGTIRETFQTEPGDSQQAIVEILSRHINEDSTEINEEINDIIDTDALSKLLDVSKSSAACAEITFTISNYDVRITASDTSSGEVIISPHQKHSEVNEYTEEVSDDTRQIVEIGIHDEITEGQFSTLEEELGLTDYEREVFEFAVRRFVEMKVEGNKLDMSESTQDATANIIASTLLQEYNQIGT
jgi:hypothetical protein